MGFCAGALLFAAAIAVWGAGYRTAEPGYEYAFPRDHFSHPEFQTEWWYYTGNLFDKEGRRFGFELTFFRQAMARAGDDSPWNLEDLYLAHLALTDAAAGEFHHFERVNRAGPGLAGASFEKRRIWNGNWQVVWSGEVQQLRAVSDRFTLQLNLTPSKPPVIHGKDGISRKAAGPGRASHYVSFTRLHAGGQLMLDGGKLELRGSAWMDHEFFTHQLGEDQTGWDWMSIQLEDGTDVMLFRLRRKDGTIDPFSAGTFVDAGGRPVHLESLDFEMIPGRRWKDYPVEWTVRVPGLDLELRATTPVDGQELVSGSGYSPAYWEGAMDFEGVRAGKPVRGIGYLEMTGYEAPVTFGQEDD